MLPKNQRIHHLKEFEAIFKNSYSCYSQILGIKSFRSGLGGNRFGVIVSTKVSKKAVARNLIKRRLRFLLRKLSEELKIGFDIVIIALPPIAAADYSQVEAALVYCLKRLRLLKSNEG